MCVHFWKYQNETFFSARIIQVKEKRKKIGIYSKENISLNKGKAENNSVDKYKVNHLIIVIYSVE